MSTTTKRVYQVTAVRNSFSPKKGERYFFINRNFLVASRIYDGGADDRRRAAKNNVFGNFKAAHPARKQMVAALQAAQGA